MIQPGNRLPVGWGATEATRDQALLPRAHANYEKQTLNYIDKKSTQIFT